MLRTQIYLPEEVYKELINWAKAIDVSMAEVIRRLIEEGLRTHKKDKSKGNDLMKLAELKIKGGPKDLSAKFDSYLYQ